jgi:receptor expression-enhancing protein 1/2/3/4
MYWTVIGAFVAFEYVAEWLISWQALIIDYSVTPSQIIPSSCRLPFYWEVKTMFLLYLSLPQIQVCLVLARSQSLILRHMQGSTYIYMTYLQPFFHQNERELDLGIVTLQRNVLTFLQAKFMAMWGLIASFTTNQQQPAGQGNPPVSWLSPDAVRAALSMIYSRPGAQPAQAMSRQNTNVGVVNPIQPSHETTAVPPPFPVPQHFQPSS